MQILYQNVCEQFEFGSAREYTVCASHQHLSDVPDFGGLTARERLRTNVPIAKEDSQTGQVCIATKLKTTLTSLKAREAKLFSLPLWCTLPVEVVEGRALI